MLGGAVRRALANFPARAVMLPRAGAVSLPSQFVPPLPAAVLQLRGVRFFAAGKPKTHSGVKKRFKITASGRVKYAQYVDVRPRGGRRLLLI